MSYWQCGTLSAADGLSVDLNGGFNLTTSECFERVDASKWPLKLLRIRTVLKFHTLCIGQNLKPFKLKLQLHHNAKTGRSERSLLVLERLQ